MNQIVIHDARQKQWLKFTQPTYVMTTHSITEVVAKLQSVNELVRQHNMYAVGFISYEAAAAFDEALVTHDSSFPLLWFGLYEQPEQITLPTPSTQNYNLNWLPTVTKTQYDRAIAQIKQYISCGDTYQVNYTMRLQADFTGNAWDYFLQLSSAQQGYGAYIELDDWVICSASPELFFTWDGKQIVTRPMKGTSARGLTTKCDRAMARWLQNSVKNRAENVMIVDMIRNDLARVADLHSVSVPSLFDIEQYPTLWQMTSTVTANTKASVPEIITALFPCASITGAPKTRTMEIIRSLEKTPRNIYTGTIGFITPNNYAQFNVAIRTVLIDRQANRAQYGVGGGIVWDSVSAREYEECQIKARVLVNNRSFQLLETILWTPHEGYFLLDYHLQRLQDSALYFKFSIDLTGIKKRLLEVSNKLQYEAHKVRLMVDKVGKLTIETIPFVPNNPAKVVNVAIAKKSIDLRNKFLYHKTTKRHFYNEIRQLHPDCDDVLLWNERQEITESCIANVVVKLNGKLLTPPVDSGLLAGTFRAYLLESKEIEEAVIKLEDISKCESIYLINSVRKWQKANLLHMNQVV